MGAAVAVVVLISAAPGASATLEERVAKVAGDGPQHCDKSELKAIALDPGLSRLSSLLRSSVYILSAICGADDATRMLKLATAEKDAPAMAWGVRFMNSAAEGDRADALAALDKAADLSADGTLSLYIDDIVTRFARRVFDDRRDFGRLMDALDRIDWKPNGAGVRADWLWAEHADRLIQQGDLVGARRAVARVRLPGPLLKMSLDSRYDRIVAADPGHFDILGAALEVLDVDMRLLKASPGDADLITGVSSDLRTLGRTDQAVEITDRALETPGPLRNADGQDKRNWVMDERGYALFELGRYDDAIQVMKAAAAQAEDRGPNVSQTINLAGLLNAGGRHAEAVEVLKPLDAKGSASDYGVMWIAAERVCALTALQRPADAATPMAFTRAHEKDNFMARAKALLCVDDMDGLAAHFIARLKSPDDRGEALLQLSRYKKPIQQPFDAELSRRMEVLRTRPDVLAAVATVGRTAEVPIYAATLIDAY